MSAQAIIRFATWTIALVSLLRPAAGDEVRADVAGQVNTLAELKSRLGGAPTPQFPFVITGVVTHVSNDQKDTSFILRDGTGLFEFFRPEGTAPFEGAITVVCGAAKVPDSRTEPWTTIWQTKVLGRTNSADQVLSVALGNLDRPDAELKLVKTEAIVVDVFGDDLSRDYDFLLLKDGETILPAYGPHDPAYRSLVDARIELTGLVKRGISSERKFVGTCLAIRGIGDLRTLVPPPADPFDFPALPRLFYIEPRDVARLDKCSTRGTVLAVWQRRHLLLRADDGRLIGVDLASGETPPRYGTRIAVAGYPTTDLFRINLTRARVRADDGAPFTEEPPERLSADRLILPPFDGSDNYNNTLFGRLLTIRGTVRATPRPLKGDCEILLECEGVMLPVDLSACPSRAAGLELDSLVEATGRCIFETARWQPTDVLPRIKGLALVVRRPDDVRVLANPPWWTPGRLSVVIILLFAALVGVYARSRLLRRIARVKFRERTQLAVELHDSLSQTLAGLACQIAAAKDDFDDSPDQSKRKLTTAEQMLNSCRTELKNCLFDLRNDTMGEKTFHAAILRTVEPFADEAEIRVLFCVRRTDFDDAAVHAVLAIVRELVANAIRHGHATRIRVSGAKDANALAFSVTDNGRGFDPERCAGPDEGHFGLDGIRERVEQLDGTFSITSSPDGGTRAVVRLPLAKP